LERVAESWLEATIAKGQRVPEPTEMVGFSGKLVLRLQKSLHKKAAYLAAREGVSLNSFIQTAVAEHVGSLQSRATANFYVHIGMFQAPSIKTAAPGQSLTASTGDQFSSVPVVREWAHAGT